MMIEHKISDPSQYCIVLVDDEIPILNALRRTLKPLGFQIISFSVPDEAIEFIACHEVHVLVTDFRMPLMDGNTLLNSVRKVSPNTVGFVLSGYTDADMLVEMINLGLAFKFLHKPWKKETLYEAINLALHEYEKRHTESIISQLYSSESSVIVELNDALLVSNSNISLSDSRLLFNILLSIEKGSELIRDFLDNSQLPISLRIPIFGCVTLNRKAIFKNKYIVEITEFSSIVVNDNQTLVSALTEITAFLNGWDEYFVFTIELFGENQLRNLKHELKKLYKNVVCVRDVDKNKGHVWIPTEKFSDPNRIKIEIEIILESISYTFVSGDYEATVDTHYVKRQSLSVSE